MPFAANDKISKAPIESGVEISEQEYKQAREHLLSGKLVKVDANKIFLTEKPEKRIDHEEPTWQNGEWYHKPIEQKQKSIEELAKDQRREIERARKAAEDDGVNVNGIRYSGSRDNRTEILQALQSADDSGIDAFPRWKDSDNQFHFNHPVADVRTAIRQIATRRSELINKEGQLSAQIDAALETGDRTALESVSWSNG